MANRPNPTGLPTPPVSPRANSHQIPREKACFLDGTPAARSDPEGTKYTPVGPGTKAWAATSSKGK
jgi:hypothetical protein